MNVLIGIIMCILNFFIAYGGVMLWDKIQSEVKSQPEQITEIHSQQNISTPSFAKESTPVVNKANSSPILNTEVTPAPAIAPLVETTPVPAPIVENTPVVVPAPPVVVENMPTQVLTPEPVVQAPAQEAPAPAVQDSINKMFNDGNSGSNADKYKNMETQHSNMLNNIDRLMQ